jgi:hypothetical protein
MFVLLDNVHIFEPLNNMSKQVPDSLKGAKSPFLENLTIPVIAKRITEDTVTIGKVKVEDGIVVSTGPVNKITKGFVIEKDRKVELYYENNKEDLRPVYSAISKEGRMLLDYILFYALRENKLYCYIDGKDFMEKYSIASRTTFWNCKKNLIDLTFISATSCQGWFWINPRFMFKGYRSKLVELQDNLKYSNE